MTINNNVEFERQVIGCILKDSTHSNCREILDSISVEDFTDYERGGIFNAIKKMSEAKYMIDPILVDEFLIKNGFKYSGIIILFEMVKEVISFANLVNYAKNLKAESQKRNLVAIINTALVELNSHRDTLDVISTINDEIKALEINSNGRCLIHLREVEGSWFDRLEDRANSSGAIKGLTTGIDELDDRIGGIDEQSLVVIAGAPSMGKTLFAQTITTHIGIDKKENIMFFSMEMSDLQLYDRFVSSVGNICPKKLKTGRLSTEEFARVDLAVRAIRGGGIHLTDEAKQSVGQIRSKVRRHKAKNPDLKGVVVDYLGLMKLGKASTHAIAIGNITRDLKELAKEMNVPIFLLVQANRGLYGAKRPNMSHLKDSSCIEADADLILFIHRQEIIDDETELKGITEIIIAKDRHGDGNGTVYAEKINGSFKGLTSNEVANILHMEEMRLNPKKSTKHGM
ncbi:MAG TPA: hypothetical protein EYN67_11015 [Flavobacteriales bacterium]|nr:hypothetical protein [Methylococcaceae bacterium]HHZ96061.1 hypothetical protein [Flavobacteriales bacterium]